MKQHYRQLSIKTIETYAKMAGVWIGDGRIAILTGLEVWHTVTAKEIQSRELYRLRFWRMIFLGPKFSHCEWWSTDGTGQFYSALPTPEAIHRGMARPRNLRPWLLVAENRSHGWFYPRRSDGTLERPGRRGYPNGRHFRRGKRGAK